MTTFFDRTPAEQEIIRKAYEFEINAIETNSSDRNPYATALHNMGLWEAFNEAVEMAFDNKIKKGEEKCLLKDRREKFTNPI